MPRTFVLKHERKIELVFLALTGGLFLWSFAAWVGVLSSDSMHRPFQSMLLAAAMMMQPLAVLLRHRSVWLFGGLLFVSGGLLIWVFVLMGRG